MGKRITIIQGHPDCADAHLCHALADAYAFSAAVADHEIRRVEVATLDFPLLRSQQDFEHGEAVPDIRMAQDAIYWAEHIVLVCPLWLGTVPALLKGFLEQVFRPGFAFSYGETSRPTMHLRGRSARIIVTMGMPALLYRWYFGAHGLKNLERCILKFCGLGPVRETLFGRVGTADEARRRKWLARVAALGRRGA